MEPMAVQKTRFTYGIRTLNNSRHSVVLDGIILSQTMPVYRRAIGCEAVNDMNLDSISLDAKLEAFNHVSDELTYPVSFDKRTRNGVVDTKYDTFIAIRGHGHVGNFEPVLLKVRLISKITLKCVDLVNMSLDKRTSLVTPVSGTSVYQSVSILYSHHLDRSSAVFPAQALVDDGLAVAEGRIDDTAPVLVDDGLAVAEGRIGDTAPVLVDVELL